jgi:hypothetical protein
MENNKFSFCSTNMHKANIDFFSNKTLSHQNKALYSNSNQHTTTPSIKQLCKNLDDDLNKLMNDIEFTTNSTNFTLNNSVNLIINDDLDKFNEYLEVNLKQFGTNISTSLVQIIEDLKAEDINDDLRYKKILFICRFSHALVNLVCPSLKLFFTNINLNQSRKNQVINSKIIIDQTESNTNISLKKKQILNESKVF